jgi:hypothetical protein
MISRIAIATGIAMLSTLAAVPLASAQTPAPAPAEEQTKAEQRKQAAEQRRKEAEQRAAAKKAELEQKKKERELNPKSGQTEEAKLAKCKAAETRIKTLMTRQGARGEKQLALIGAIVTRVQAYKTEKNLTVANYDTLLADVEAKKAAAQTAIDNAKAAQVDFKCDSADPQKAGEIVRELVKAQHEALKAYKEATIKLLVAVKQSQGDKPAAPAPPASPTPTTPTTPPTPPTTPTTPPATPTPSTNPEDEE